MIRSRCIWFELGETSNKFSLNLEKYWASHSTIRKVIYDAQEVTDHHEINNHFLKKNCKMTIKTLESLKDVPIASLTEEQRKFMQVN